MVIGTNPEPIVAVPLRMPTADAEEETPNPETSPSLLLYQGKAYARGSRVSSHFVGDTGLSARILPSPTRKPTMYMYIIYLREYIEIYLSNSEMFVCEQRKAYGVRLQYDMKFIRHRERRNT